MPGPRVHFGLTIQWAIEEGMTEADAEVVATANVEVDLRWPGARRWGRHFNPMATLHFARSYMSEAMRFESDGAHAQALEALGRALHSLQDGVGHGRLGLAHLKYRSGLLSRHPDDWDHIPPRARARIERVTRAAVSDFLNANRHATR